MKVETNEDFKAEQNREVRGIQDEIGKLLNLNAELLESGELTNEDRKIYNERIEKANTLLDKVDNMSVSQPPYLPTSDQDPDYWSVGGSGSGGAFRKALKGQLEGRAYRDMFGPATDDFGFKSFDEFATHVRLGKLDDRLQRTMVEGTPSDGGFAVPTEYAAEIFDVSLESEIVRPRATIHPMLSNEKVIPAVVLGDHSANLYGGVIGYWTAESGSLTETEPEFRSMKLTAEKLTVYGRSSSEWLDDAVMSGKTVQRTFSNGLNWYMDRAFIKGTGAGQPLGILNAPCLIAVSKEVGQTAGTVVYQNLSNMIARLHPACFARSVWVAHPGLIPSLLELEVGSGGTHVPVMKDTGGAFSILTRPVIFSEKMETAGSQGDIVLADFSQYAVGIRKELRLESSIHVHFATDEVAHRCIARVDGQPLWDEALTLEDGSTTVGPFVTLEERA